MTIFRKIKAWLLSLIRHEIVIVIEVQQSQVIRTTVRAQTPTVISVAPVEVAPVERKARTKTVFKCSSKHKTVIPIHKTRPPRCGECGEAL